MLKKAGIVVLGATAGMLSLAPLASAGEAPSHGGDHGNHGHHHDDDGDRGHRGGDCDKTAISSGNRLVSLDNLASNLDADNINVLSQDNSRDSDCDGGGRGGRDGHGHGGHGGHGGGGDRTAISSGDRLISADNILANASLDNINVLSTDNSR